MDEKTDEKDCSIRTAVVPDNPTTERTCGVLIDKRPTSVNFCVISSILLWTLRSGTSITLKRLPLTFTVNSSDHCTLLEVKSEMIFLNLKTDNQLP